MFPVLNQKFSDGRNPHIGTLNGTPAAQPGFAGSHVAQIDLHLSYENERWQITSHSSTAVSPKGMPEDPEIINLSQQIHDKTLHRVARHVGQLHTPVHSSFSVLKTGPELGILASAMTQVVGQTAKGTCYVTLPILSAAHLAQVAGVRARKLPLRANGPILYRHVLQLCPFEDKICAIKITGAEVCDWLERSAATFTKLATHNPDLPVVRPGAPQYNFDVISEFLTP